MLSKIKQASGETPVLLQMPDQRVISKTTARPLWREPIAIGIVVMVVLASVGVLFQDRILTSRPADAADKSALPAAGGGGGFCDIPVPVKSTAVNPSTRKSE